MAIVLGTYTFDEARTAVSEKYEEVGGRDARIIQLEGVIPGAADLTKLEQALDAVMQAASAEGADTELSLRSGRRLFVRRTKFEREISRDPLLGAFKLTLEAEDPFEESTEENNVAWPITGSGQTQVLSTSGNADAPLVITLTATGDVVSPSFSDGERVITYDGVVEDGNVLVLDGNSGAAALDGMDVTPYVSGLFPHVMPVGNDLTYTDDASSSHTASVTVAYWDRWW